MPSYFLKCGKNIESKNPKISRAKNEKLMLLLKCGVYNSRKLKLLKASGLLGSLGVNLLRASFVLEVLADQYKM